MCAGGRVRRAFPLMIHQLFACCGEITRKYCARTEYNQWKWESSRQKEGWPGDVSWRRIFQVWWRYIHTSTQPSQWSPVVSDDDACFCLLCGGGGGGSFIRGHDSQSNDVTERACFVYGMVWSLSAAIRTDNSNLTWPQTRARRQHVGLVCFLFSLWTKPFFHTRSSRLDEITSLAWNRQVQHVFASSSSMGYTVVQDFET